MIKDALREAEGKMKNAINALEEDLKSVRTGRAAPALVERLMVNYYGSQTPLQQLASISAPEPQLLTIRPYDPGSIPDIEKAIQASELGLTPDSDGQMVRLSIPPLTKERRQELIKVVSKRVEEAKVSVRNARRDTLDEIREYEKEKLVSEDEFHRGKDDLQSLTDKNIKLVDEIGGRKEQELSSL